MKKSLIDEFTKTEEVPTSREENNHAMNVIINEFLEEEFQDEIIGEFTQYFHEEEYMDTSKIWNTAETLLKEHMDTNDNKEHKYPHNNKEKPMMKIRTTKATEINSCTRKPTMKNSYTETGRRSSHSQ